MSADSNTQGDWTPRDQALYEHYAAVEDLAGVAVDILRRVHWLQRDLGQAGPAATDHLLWLLALADRLGIRLNEVVAEHDRLHPRARVREQAEVAAESRTRKGWR